MLTAEILHEAHEASVRMAELEEFSGVKTGSDDTHGQYLEGLRFRARNAVFEDLGPGRQVISGGPVVEGVESLFYALGQDAEAAQTSAARLAGVVELSDQTDTPELILSSGGGRTSHVGTLATDEYRAGGVYLSTKTLAEQPSFWDRHFADLVIPYGSSFLADDDGRWVARTSRTGEAVDISVKGLVRAEEPAIFDDPEEAAAFRKQYPNAAFMLVGSEAVLSMFDEMDSQSAVATQNMLEATVYNREHPSVEGIDLVGAVGVGISALIKAGDYPAYMPAEAHPSILAQMSLPELMSVSRSAVSGISREEFAKSGRLRGLKLNRKLEAAISDIAHQVVTDFVDHAGVTEDISEQKRKVLEADLITGYALSLEDHLAFNHLYKHAIRPFGPRMQRRSVARVMRAHQAG